MAFKREEEHRNFELTGLIDIVFLLLIFFLIFFAFSVADESPDPDVQSMVDLPHLSHQHEIIRNDVLQNLTIQIVDDTTKADRPRVAYVLWPGFADTSQVSRYSAFKQARQDSTFAEFPPDYVTMPKQKFVTLPPCTLISNSINRYIQRIFDEGGGVHPRVEIIAEQDTEFRLIGFILHECSAHKDTIPQLSVRVLPERNNERDYGFQETASE